MSATSISFGLLILVFAILLHPLDAHEREKGRIRITKDVPILRIDHISAKSLLECGVVRVSKG